MELLRQGYQFQLRNLLEDAARCYRKILKAAPDNADVLHLLAMVRSNQNRLTEAVELYRAAIARKPGDAKLWYNLGLAHASAERNAEGAEAMARALELNPDLPEAVGMLFSLRRKECDWRGHEALMQALRDTVDPARPAAPPFFVLWIDDPHLHLAAARRAVEKKGIGRGRTWRHDPAGRKPGRIRVGYVSADFRNHPTAHLMTRLLELHDRSRFEVTAISIGPSDGSAYRARLETAVDRFMDCDKDAPGTTAEKIRALDIDILVDVMGHTGNNRMEIFGETPAPIQVSYLAHPGTAGAACLHYVIADPFILPFSEAAHFSEKIVHLPETYQPNDPTLTPAMRPSRRECGLPDEGFVFCAFNNLHKLGPETFDIWMRLLSRVPASVLWLQVDAETARGNLRREAEARGIAPERLVFAPRAPLAEHLARTALADLFLDTFPYTAHTTASDTLRMGVPLITRTGKSFGTKVAASLMRLCGLEELVTQDAAGYEALALALALDPPRLTAWRSRLADALPGSPLFDTDRYRRHLESAYETMMARWLSGQSPEAFAVPALPR